MKTISQLGGVELYIKRPEEASRFKQGGIFNCFNICVKLFRFCVHKFIDVF